MTGYLAVGCSAALCLLFALWAWAFCRSAVRADRALQRAIEEDAYQLRRS